MRENDIFIAQQNLEDALYTRLQRMTTDQLQNLSGKVWTDFNISQPGVTIADIANYVLTELDYKLGFDLLDYLTDENGEFPLQKYGLYLPEEIYPTTPITLFDYQKLLLSQFPLLKNVIFICDDHKKGCYNIDVELYPFYESNTNNIKKQIYNCFHANRNLCENINLISIRTPPVLHLYAEVDIEPGNDAVTLLAQIYWTIQKYLAGSIKIKQRDEQNCSDLSPDEWLEGINTNNQRVIIPKQSETHTELYHKLEKIKGIKSFKTIYLVSIEGDKKHIITDFKKKYSLYIPKYQSDFKVKIRIDKSDVIIELERFLKEMQAIYFSQTSSHLNQQLNKPRNDDFISCESLPQGVYRDVYNHKNMAYDFPSHYGIGEAGLPASVAIKTKATAKQLKAYLTLFDLLIRRGLSELKGLRDLLAIKGENSGSITQTIISQNEWNDATAEISTQGDDYKIIDGGSDYSKMLYTDKFRDINALKNRYLNCLDKLYGVNTSPSWMNEYRYYGKTDDIYLERRIKFLQIVPSLTRDRSKAFDIRGPQNKNNLCTIKTYISALLNLNLNEDISVGNILPSHNLILTNDSKDNEKLRDVINYKLITDALKLSQVESIAQNKRPETDEEKYKDYEELRRYLPFFHDHLISGGLFRSGIQLENYKLILVNSTEFILVFWNEEDSSWMNLGRSNDKEKLKKSANTLRRYLIELNSMSEVVYVVEHTFFHPIPEAKKTPLSEESLDYQFDTPFTITFVFSNWSARFKSHRFREICCQLIESLVPAHIKTHIYWMNIPQITVFENNYNRWRIGLSNDYPITDQIQLQQGIYDIFWEMENETNMNKR